MSITNFPAAAEGGTPKGSERSLWWVMIPRAAGTQGNAYQNARGLASSADVMPGYSSGGAGAYATQISPTLGAYRNLQGVTNGAPVFVTLGANSGIEWLPPRFDRVLAGAPPFIEVYIFRELIQRVASGPLPAGHQAQHGFSLIGNLLAGFPQLTTGSWRGIAVTERTTDVVLAVKNANPATIIPLPGVSLASQIKLEHRLYSPTPTRIGRYELWINDALAETINGDHPNWPHPVAVTEGWKPMPFSLNNPGTATTVAFRGFWGEIIAGPDSEGTY